MSESIRAILARANANLDRVIADIALVQKRVRAHLDDWDGIADDAPTPVIAKPNIVPYEKPIDVPDEFPGEGHPAVRAVLRAAAAKSGIFPWVLEAIQVWETGHYKNPKARAWHQNNNPGGMKDTATTDRLGADPDYQGTYAKFDTWVQGMMAHGEFFKQSRYAGIVTAASTAAQVYVIWDAGYSGRDPKWLENVTQIAQKLESAYKNPPPSIENKGALTSNDELIRARSAIGKGIAYSQAMQPDGDNPNAPLPGSMKDGQRVCDCSLYLAWAKRYKRGDDWSTGSIVADARGAQRCWKVVPKGSAKPGHAYCYNNSGIGHCGYIATVSGGIPKTVIHCHSGQEPALEETGPEIFERHNALILEYVGPRYA